MNCADCGKKLGFFEKKKKLFLQGDEGDRKVRKKAFCIPCFEKYIKELESKTSCYDCAYSELREDHSFGLDIPPRSFLFCKKLDLEVKPNIVIYSEFNLSLINPSVVPLRKFCLDAEKCVHFITEEEYRESALRGEIVRGKEVKDIVCEYCDTHYDASKYVRCPNCCATTRK